MLASRKAKGYARQLDEADDDEPAVSGRSGGAAEAFDVEHTLRVSSTSATESVEATAGAAREEAVSAAYLLAVTCPMYGIGLSWGAQYAKVTPILQVLGISDSMLGVAWLAGPVAGIVVQPIVGDLSDRWQSRFGRRRVWMWAGAFGQVVSMVLMSLAPEIGAAAGDVKGAQPVALATAVVTFWLADLSINAQQAPARTLIVDVAPPRQLAQGNGYFSLWDSVRRLPRLCRRSPSPVTLHPLHPSPFTLIHTLILTLVQVGKITGFFLGSVDAAAHFPSLSDDYAGDLFAGVRLVFLVAICALLGTMVVVQSAVQEAPLTTTTSANALGGGGGGRSAMAPIVDAFRSVPTLPREVRCMFATLFFLFFTWFATWMYLPALMGIDVYGGSPDPGLADNSTLKQQYNEGVLASSEGTLGASCVTLALTLTLTPTPTLALYAGMLGASCVTLALAFVVPRATIALGEMRVFFQLEVLHVLLLLGIATVRLHARDGARLHTCSPLADPLRRPSTSRWPQPSTSTFFHLSPDLHPLQATDHHSAIALALALALTLTR